ncbi:MAG: ABC transporter substrate-binding protein [Hyphomicrobiales bacterium]|nr:ABC transporter substrate-binding protein [Hyphomicrobiales bacterium]MDE2115554.1 ABC transporter substrate-binding protein [Hyphomicrobiales bacterium]
MARDMTDNDRRRLNAAAGFALISALLLVYLAIRYVPRTIAAMSHVSVAVTADSSDAKLLTQISKSLKIRHSSLKLILMPVSSPAAAAAAMQQGRAELAVVRTDGELPKNGDAVLVMHHDALLLLVPQKGKVKEMGDLANKTIGLVQDSPENRMLLDALLTQFGLQASNVKKVPVRPLEIVSAFNKKQIDAVANFGPLRDSNTDSVVAAVTSASGNAVRIVPVPGAEGIADHHLIFRKVDIAQSYFAGAPPQPEDDDFAVLGTDYLLMAQHDMSEARVSELTQAIFTLRGQLVAAGYRHAAEIDKMDTDKGTIPAVHAGAIDYYSDSQKSFMDRYGDEIYLIGIIISILGSATAGLLSLVQGRRRRSAMDNLDDLVRAKARVAQAQSPEELRSLSDEIENYATQTLLHARDNNFDPNGLAAVRLAIDEARKSVFDRAQSWKSETAPDAVDALHASRSG